MHFSQNSINGSENMTKVTWPAGVSAVISKESAPGAADPCGGFGSASAAGQRMASRCAAAGRRPCSHSSGGGTRGGAPGGHSCATPASCQGRTYRYCSCLEPCNESSLGALAFPCFPMRSLLAYGVWTHWTHSLGCIAIVRDRLTTLGSHQGDKQGRALSIFPPSLPLSQSPFQLGSPGGVLSQEHPC